MCAQDAEFTAWTYPGLPGRVIVARPPAEGAFYHFAPAAGGFADRGVIHVARHLLERAPIAKIADKLRDAKTKCAEFDAAIALEWERAK